MRYEDAIALLDHVDQDIKTLLREYNEALQEKELPRKLQIDVKNAMENLRSCLDYIAQDVYEIIVRPNLLKNGKKEPLPIYFPYGRTEINFRNSVNRNLPDLDVLNSTLFDLIGSVQPHKCNQTWLVDLCSTMNENKHDSLTPQEKSESTRYEVGRRGHPPVISAPAGMIQAPPGMIRIGGAPVAFDNSSGVPLESSQIAVKTTRWVDFRFQGTTISVLPLLKKSKAEIRDLTEDIYSELT